MEFIFYSVLAICFSSLAVIFNYQRLKVAQEVNLKEAYEQIQTVIATQNSLVDAMERLAKSQQQCLDLRDDLNKVLVANGFKIQERKAK